MSAAVRGGFFLLSCSGAVVQSAMSAVAQRAMSATEVLAIAPEFSTPLPRFRFGA